MNIDQDAFADVVGTLAASVHGFHERFEIGPIEPADLDGTLEALRQRLSLLAEEMGEHARALNRGDLGDATTEAVDIAYIALGTLLRLGEAGRAACFAVADKNDSKTPATHGKLTSTGKVVQT